MDNYPIPSIPSKYWKAISNNDSDFDNEFYYGVKTTKIFCRPSCKSRVPNKNNVYIFKEAQSALELGFRPCKRCKPDNLLLPNEEWVEIICEWMDKNFQDDITLNSLSEIFHSSPFHLQRTFNKVKGESPLAYLQKKRLTTAAKKLKDTNYPIQLISSEVGFPNNSYFSTVFKKYYQVTPNNYRKQFR
ncbi:bifunctional transcriptional activator/DNA repair enzyme AdaA [Sediminibacillus albus]|uniref:AraC family transcriptional regulator, regulatory protein of adaptative response / methylphosphotriester-DNA alkyltransferase methyltransferase n=1 Tax=Sediminibacillus albus TaxID=407036 RepID=A0A1G8YDM1_9BACI|nr:Ada metal-binding domain-containing protein [Sediminibacillus albus]SDK00315.1 AraC family transcriptional regulator, regulatory protein of adaptative response / methylphosphotriester-DNA alkyltransferase methyltransferase [Sediminibacillus albus]